MSFKQMTPQQRATYRALRELGGTMVVTPDVSRQLRALQARGLVRYGREYGERVAILRRPRAQVAKQSRWIRDSAKLYSLLQGSQS